MPRNDHPPGCRRSVVAKGTGGWSAWREVDPRRLLDVPAELLAAR